MNHPFIKMLKFEWKANRKMWIIITSIGMVLLTLLSLTRSSINTMLSYSLFYLLTMIFTLLGYQESTNNQSMTMYHLIPEERNIKFWSKIFITLIAFPSALYIFGSLVLSPLMSVFTRTSSPNQSSELFSVMANSSQIIILLIAFWFFSQSASTLIAIIFKKYKILYAILVYWGFQLLMTPVILIGSFIPARSVSTMHQPFAPISLYILLVIALTLVIYGISYRLFFRRQL